MSNYVMVLDIEANQPSGSIVEVGMVALDLDSGLILPAVDTLVKLPPGEDFNGEYMCRQDLPLKKLLSHITSEWLDLKGVTPEGAGVQVEQALKKAHTARVITWGGGDWAACREQLGLKHLHVRVLDLKAYFMVLGRTALGVRSKAGLASVYKAMAGYEFESHHTAFADAAATAEIAYKMYKTTELGRKTLDLAEEAREW